MIRHSRIAGSLALVSVIAFACAASAQVRRVRLEVLVMNDGGFATTSFMAALDEGLVPYTVVDLGDPARPTIDAVFLTDAPAPGVVRGNYQAIVMPTSRPWQLADAELAALHDYERAFGVRQLSAYVYPNPALALNWPANPGYFGVLDGLEAQVTAEGIEGHFGYLVGPVPFDDVSATVSESYGALATPLAAPPAGVSFTPLVSAPIPGSSEMGVVVGVLHDGGRDEMVITAAMNQYQLQHELLFEGILNWLTYGVHFGYHRNYLAVHIDDVFLSDARWVMDHDCTVGDGCPPWVSAPEILMTPEDVRFLLEWQRTQGIKLEMVFNGGGYDAYVADERPFPLGESLLRNRRKLRWVNHTYSHEYLGCVKNYGVSPWACETDAMGNVVWVPFDLVYDEIFLNIDFANEHDIPIDPSMLVPGEHSGLVSLPEVPADNPNFVAALAAAGIRWVGSDDSREGFSRPVGEANTIPRYPMNIFYNVGTKAEEVDEYNWIYTAGADGGSGICEVDPRSTCVEPLDPANGFEAYIVPLEARFMLMHMLGNSPKPHFAHQSNLAEDRVLYPVLDEAIARYRSLYASNTRVLNPTFRALGEELARRGEWWGDRGRVDAYVEDGRLYVSHHAGSHAILNVPLTLPPTTRAEEEEDLGWFMSAVLRFLNFWNGGGEGDESEEDLSSPRPAALEPYGVGRSAWTEVSGEHASTFELPDGVGYAR